MDLMEIMPLLDAKSEKSKRGKGNKHYLTYNGKTLIKREWAKALGVHETTILKRCKQYEAGKIAYEDIFK